MQTALANLALPMANQMLSPTIIPFSFSHLIQIRVKTTNFRDFEEENTLNAIEINNLNILNKI